MAQFFTGSQSQLLKYNQTTKPLKQSYNCPNIKCIIFSSRSKTIKIIIKAIVLCFILNICLSYINTNWKHFLVIDRRLHYIALSLTSIAYPKFIFIGEDQL